MSPTSSENPNTPAPVDTTPQAERTETRGKLEISAEVRELMANLNPELPEAFRDDAIVTASM